MKIDLIVVTYKPTESFLEMMQAVSEQTQAVNKIIIYNVEQKYFDRITYSAKFASDYKNSEIHHISRREFDNGRTRNQAVKCSAADYFIMLAQDAIPTDKEVFANLVKAISQSDDIAVAYGRHIEREDSKEYAKYIMQYFYPDDSNVRSSDDIEKYGSLAYQSSNACAIYRRDIFDSLGGFVNHAIANEDVLYAAEAVNAGYKIAYSAEAKIIYSYVREKDEIKPFFFDAAVSYVKHPEVFNMTVIMNRTRKVVKMTKAHLAKKGISAKDRWEFNSVARRMLAGMKLGRRYKSMSQSRILKITTNPGYWRTDEIMRDRSGVNARLGYGRSAEELNMLSKPPVTQNKPSSENDIL